MSLAVTPADHRGAVLAVDQGTTNTKAVLLDAELGTPICEASASTAVRFPRPGWVEQDAEQILDATLGAIDRCLAQAPAVHVLGIGITNQRESTVCWSRTTGKSLGPVLGWQDARTSRWCDELSDAEPRARQMVRSRTGLGLDAMFSAPKFKTSIDASRAEGTAAEDIAVGTIDAWLIWKLTGEHATDLGNASRTLLLDLESMTWHDELLELFGYPGGLCLSCDLRTRPSGSYVLSKGGDSWQALRWWPSLPTPMPRCTTTGAPESARGNPPTALGPP